MIEGLRLTMTGEELRKRLQDRVKDHERRAAWYKAEAKREADPEDEYDFVLPEHMCEHEEERHSWRAEVLAYIREHIEGGEVAQVEYEEQHRIGFSLERIAKEIGRSRFGLEYELRALARGDQTVPGDQPSGARPEEPARRQRKRKQTARA